MPLQCSTRRNWGQLIDVISNIQIGGQEARSRDVLGQVYEYFLSRFASAEGKKRGEFYTPRCIFRLLVEMLQPFQRRIYDPCCGSSGMFVQSVEFIHGHARGNGGGRAGIFQSSDRRAFCTTLEPHSFRLIRGRTRPAEQRMLPGSLTMTPWPLLESTH